MENGLLSARVFYFQGYPWEQPLKVASKNSSENKRPKLIGIKGFKPILELWCIQIGTHKSMKDVTVSSIKDGELQNVVYLSIIY